MAADRRQQARHPQPCRQQPRHPQPRHTPGCGTSLVLVLSALAPAALAFLLPLPPPLASPASAQTSLGAPDPSNPFRKPEEQRPAGLVLLREWQTMAGAYAIGVYDAKLDPRDPAARTIVVWLEEPTGVKLAVETLRCSPSAPMRLTRRGRDLVIRDLNPGGPVTEANRLDQQIWWAACFPEQAGKDPAALVPLARRLGYSGTLREQQQVLPANPR